MYLSQVSSIHYPHVSPGESKEAREEFQRNVGRAILSGFKLIAFSTYRSFDYQTGLYERYVERDGSEAADRYSARPGYSEHQTGLAFDIGEVNNEQFLHHRNSVKQMPVNGSPQMHIPLSVLSCAIPKAKKK